MATALCNLSKQYGFSGVKIKMNMLFIITIFIAMLSMSGCTKWERRGATEFEHNSEYAACKALGYERFPPDLVTNFEFDFKDQYVPCDDKKKCSPYRKIPSFRTVEKDRNKSARDSVIESCMYEKGWHEKTYYWPPFS
ncbi:hypothetical protein [Symbiopectobacterium sp. RP]|uniref:hypothetical protein n=1 Tax=Symbiopectobacterium sp. RP TaxID=3248553 RepID=UPI003D27B606